MLQQVLKVVQRLKDLDENQLEALREQVLQYEVEGDLRREVTMSIKRLMDMGMLSWVSPSSWFALSWTKNQNECAYS